MRLRGGVVVAVLAIVVIGFATLVLFAPIPQLWQLKESELAALGTIGVPDDALWRVGLIPSDYPLGDFAHVGHWGDVLRNENGVNVSKMLDGRTDSYSFPGGGAGGMLGLSNTAFGRIGPHGEWVAAIPLVSGGSGGVFSIAVFEAERDGSVRHLGTISDGDRSSAAIDNGRIVVTTPYREPNACMACYTEEYVNDYQVTEHGPVRVRQRVLPLSELPTAHAVVYNVFHPSTSQPIKANSRVVTDEYSFPILFPASVRVPDVPSGESVLILSRRIGDYAEGTRAFRVTPYHGGLTE